MKEKPRSVFHELYQKEILSATILPIVCSIGPVILISVHIGRTVAVLHSLTLPHHVLSHHKIRILAILIHVILLHAYINRSVTISCVIPLVKGATVDHCWVIPLKLIRCWLLILWMVGSK